VFSNNNILKYDFGAIKFRALSLDTSSTGDDEEDLS
jgi:hypothetical protein